MHSYAHVLSFALEEPWAVTPAMLRVIATVLGRKVAGREATAEEIDAALVNRKNLPQPTEGGSVAVIPVYGVLAPRANLMSQMSGGTSFEQLTGMLREAMANAAIKTIVLDVDSPGGSVAGATEFAREVARARTRKPIIAVAQYQMCSAAYWLAASATEIVASPSSSVGSIGVYTIHDDLSAALEAEGVKRTYIAAGKYKVDGNEAEPLSDEARERIAAKVNHFYDQFTADVAKGRGVPLETVRSGYGEGLALTAPEALAAGMVDRLGTLDETVNRALNGTPETRRAAALADRAHVERALFALSL